MQRFFGVFLLLVGSTAAWGFCGTYVGGAGAEIYNHVSEVAYVRVGNKTTLTLHADAYGDIEDFSMLVPVPEIIDRQDVHTIDASVIDAIDQYSSPRRVRYDCDDFRPREESDTDTDTDTDSDTDADTSYDVDIEAQYVVGEYSVSILSSGEAGDLSGWLNTNGYVFPDDPDGILQGYIDQGSYFLAARVDDDAELPADNRLSPLQISYGSEAMSLPIRIGTLNADGIQDLIVYAMTPYEDGAVGISNLPEATVETGCMWDAEDGDLFEDFYASQLDDIYDEQGAFWVQEYAWGSAKCDPCEGTPPDTEQLMTLGLPGRLAGTSDLFFTRLHARYAPEEADQDLMLYRTNLNHTHQQRYIDYVYELESRFPVCGVGTLDDVGVCDFDEPDTSPARAGGCGGEGADTGGGAGCSASTGYAGLLVLMWPWGRRRRRRRQPMSPRP